MPGAALEAFQHLFYRCRFRELLAKAADPAAATARDAAPITMAVYQSGSLFELHRVTDAVSLISTVAVPGADFDPERLFALAKLQYYRGAHQDSLATFQQLLELSSRSPRHRWRALLGIANVHLTCGDLHRVSMVLQELGDQDESLKVDERISAMILRGSLESALQQANKLENSAAGLSHFKSAFILANKLGWTYFSQRCLYGLAAGARAAGQQAKMGAYLEVLDCIVDREESIYFHHLVNEKFKDESFSINQPIRLDKARKRVFIRDEWIELHERPMIFAFIEVLAGAVDFVAKQPLAQKLWPAEIYHPEVHDARIFDLAKRTRQLLEAWEDQPVVLLSGRAGYKLASS